MAHLLLIDDDDLFRAMLCDDLTHRGYTVTAARDGKEGLALYAHAPADLVIVDLIMPEKEGIEVIVELKRNWPQAKIIAISGGGRIAPDNILKIARHLGAQCLFAKPFSNDELVVAIKEMLSVKKS